MTRLLYPDECHDLIAIVVDDPVGYRFRVTVYVESPDSYLGDGLRVIHAAGFTPIEHAFDALEDQQR